MRSSSRGFTLIEVLVSVLILSVVAVGLFQIATNAKHNYIFLRDKAQFDRIASIPFMHHKRDWHNSEKSLYDFLSHDYTIKEDDFRRYLKKIRVHYEQRPFTTYAPFGEEMAEENATMNFKLILDKVSVRRNKESAYLYLIQVDMGQ